MSKRTRMVDDARPRCDWRHRACPSGLRWGGPVTIGPIGMFGAQEVRGPGDPNGEGEATFSWLPRGDGSCFDLQWSKIARPTAAHTHRGQAGVAVAVRVELLPGRRGLPTTMIMFMGAFGVSTATLRSGSSITPSGSMCTSTTEDRDGAIRGELLEDRSKETLAGGSRPIVARWMAVAAGRTLTSATPRHAWYEAFECHGARSLASCSSRFCHHRSISGTALAGRPICLPPVRIARLRRDSGTVGFTPS